MAINVFSDGDAGMPEYLGDHVQRRTLREHQRGPRVAQLVRVPVTEPGPLAQPGEGVRELSGSIGVPTSLAKISP
jgi:hypothetical protein